MLQIISLNRDTTVGRGKMKKHAKRREIRNEPRFSDQMFVFEVRRSYNVIRHDSPGRPDIFGGEYYNLKQPINCYVANFLPLLYFRSFLYNVRINLVDPIWGYPHQWIHKTQLVTRVEWTSKIYCVDCKLSFRIHYLSLKASTSSLLFGSLITTVSTV